jgi:hypothetical protein
MITGPQFALRWRTEDEVLSGAGETTCGNTRCSHHVSTRFQNEGGSRVSLTTLELPFAYLEHGESKSALVKVVLCGRCVKKLMWKRTKEKEKEMSATVRESGLLGDDESKDARETNHEGEEIEKQRRKKRLREEKEDNERSSRKRRSSHTRSPTRQKGSGKGHAYADFIPSGGLFVIPITWYSFPIPVGSTNLAAALEISCRRSSVFAAFSRPCNRSGRPSCIKNGPWGMGPWVETRSD